MTDSGYGQRPSSPSSGSEESASPFSREGSRPDDALGAGPSHPSTAASAGSASEWPVYSADQPAPNATPDPYAAPAYGANPYPDQPYQGQAYPTQPYETQPYGGQAYGQPYGAQSYGYLAPNHPQAVTALVLGIVGLVICPLVGIGGLVLGGRARREIDADPTRYGGRGLATAGWVLGIISLVYSALLVLVLVAAVITSVASS